MLAAGLSASCLWLAWRAFRRASTIHSGALEAETPADQALELRLAEKELNLELSLAARRVRVWGRVALFGGTGLAILAIANGTFRAEPGAAYASFAWGLIGWGGCRELERRVGSLAESWRSARNLRRRRQGVDQPKRTE